MPSLCKGGWRAKLVGRIVTYKKLKKFIDNPSVFAGANPAPFTQGSLFTVKIDTVSYQNGTANAVPLLFTDYFLTQ